MISKEKKKLQKRVMRSRKIRSRVRGTAKRPRLSVYRSLRYIEAQVIDDTESRTIVSIHTKKLGLKGTKSEIAFEAGKMLGKLLLEQKIESIVFDRRGFRYHGRVKYFADGIREAGVQF